MNDDDLERLLRASSAQWRESHRNVASVDLAAVTRAEGKRRWRPLAAAAAAMAVLAAALVVAGIAGSKDGHGRPTAGSSPSTSPTSSASPAPSSAEPRSVRFVPLTGKGTVVDYLGDGRVILVSNNHHPGSRATLQVRSVAHPQLTTYTARSSFVRGGDIVCSSLAGDWLIYTDVEDVPTLLSPGPPQPWRLTAVNIASSERRTLAAGTADMASDFACARREGSTVAWTSGRDVSTTVYDITTAERRRVDVAGAPVGFADAGLVIAHTTMGPKTRVLLVDPQTGDSHIVADLDGGLNVTAAGQHLIWSERTSSDGNGPELLHACELPACAESHTAQSQIATTNSDVGTTAVGDTFMAWTGSGDGQIRAVTLDGTPLRIASDESATYTFAVSGNLLAYVASTRTSTRQEQDKLYLVEIS